MLLVALAMSALAGGGTSGNLFPEFDPARVPRPARGASAPVARMLDCYFTQDSLGGAGASEQDQADRLIGRVLGPIMRRYAVAEKLEAAPEEIDGLQRALSEGDTTGASDDREFAAAMVQQWKVNRSLYRRYGGVVIFQQLDPLEPVGAYGALLREMEKRKIFEIYDRGIAAGFWDRLSNDQFFEIPPDKVNFETPFWLQRPPEAGELGARAGSESSRGPVAPPPAASTPREGFTIVGGSVRFVFDPTRFESATNGETGEWVPLRSLRIETVHLAGDFNDWSPSAWLMRTAGPAGSLSLLERPFAELGGSGAHQFKFVLNRVWWVEPGPNNPNRRETGLGNRSSNLEVVIP
jgi:hypothetical protein